MNIRNLLITLWALAVFFLSFNTFDVVTDAYAVVSVPWQQRFLDSNYEYAFSIFFLFLISLWHGIATSAFGEKRILTWARLYQSLAMPLLIAFGLLSLIPLEYEYGKPLGVGSWILISLWFLLAGDASGKIGGLIASADWFKSNILKSDSNAKNFLFKGASGGFGIAVFSIAVLVLIVAGFVGY